MKTTKIGIIGCGNISTLYFQGAERFKIIEVKACADIIHENAVKKAEEYKIKAMCVDEILADSEIEIIVNLTIPAVHAEINIKALEAGKNVHSEKPLAVEKEDGLKTLNLAKEKGLLLGSAPDTFLGAGFQTCRKIIDEGWIGKPIAGSAFMMCRGPEKWHPNPQFFYLRGGGPMFDLGPYYLTALVSLLGPVKKVTAFTVATFKERIGGAGEFEGKSLRVETPTHHTGILEFESGALINMTMSFDVCSHSHTPIEIYGTEGSLILPDPNTFGGPIKIKRLGDEDWQVMPLSHIYSEQSRCIGVADMAYAIQEQRMNRCSGVLANHVLEVMHSFEESSVAERPIMIKSSCERPAPLPTGLTEGYLHILG